MTSSSRKAHFVKIQIGSSNSPKPREFGLTRWQFEVILLVIPTVFLWGLVSTAILLKTMYFDRSFHTAQDTAALPTSSNPKVPTQESGQLSDYNGMSTRTIAETDAAEEPLVKQTADNAEPITPTNAITASLPLPLASRSFRVDDIFAIDFSITRNSKKESYAATVAMTNLKGTVEAGRYWISVLALTKAGEKVWLTPMPKVRINSSGQAEDPQRGWAYSFKNFRKSDLALPKYTSELVRFEEAVIGFHRDNSPPAITKVQLISK